MAGLKLPGNMRDAIKVRTGFFIAIACMAALFVFAATLPMAFRGEVDETRPAASFAECANLFAQYWSGKESGYTVSVLEEISQEDSQYCSEYFDWFVKTSFVDRQEGLVDESDTGSSYLIVDDSHTQLRICRMWMRTAGDWSNWIEVQFDMDTGFVYYFYFSSLCLNDGENYRSTRYSGISGESIAGEIAQGAGYELRFLDIATPLTQAHFFNGGEYFCTDIIYSYAAGKMIDVKITCTL